MLASLVYLELKVYAVLRVSVILCHYIILKVVFWFRFFIIEPSHCKIRLAGGPRYSAKGGFPIRGLSTPFEVRKKACYESSPRFTVA